MLSRIISILFAVVAGAAALIGLGRGGESLRLGSNRLTRETTPTSAPRQVGQNAVTVSTPAATTATTATTATAATTATTEPIANSTFIVSSETEATTTTGTSTDAAAADPTPGAKPPVTSTTPAPRPPAATTPPAAPATAQPAPPIRAMW